ncbi:MAG: DUF3300 domain-containing protein [Verrucomicrobiota bacterium]|jgi:uncharacterized membrane protein YgcG
MKHNKILVIPALAFALISASANAQPDTPSVAPAPPPSAPAQSSATDLEKLAAPIALYPDPLIATILPASAYPLEIVQAARFVADTNNLANLDAQPWDENVKAVARVPAAIQKMNDDLPWTIALGEAFIEQPKELMDTIQSLRAKAQSLGTLKTSPQQVVIVTNYVVVQTNLTQVVMVTNQVVQIQPANPQVIYVPAYDPWYVYYPPPAYYVGPPPVVTFAVGVTVGLIIANNCDWHGGGIYVGHHGAVVWGGGGYHHGDVDIDINRNVNINHNTINNVNRTPQKWQPDQSRLRTSGSPGALASARSLESRGWSSQATPATRSAARTPTISRPNPSPKLASPAFNRSAQPAVSRGSAFGGVSNSGSARNFSNRGASSRSGSSGGGRFGGRR